jgi:hypothetical protein
MDGPSGMLAFSRKGSLSVVSLCVTFIVTMLFDRHSPSEHAIFYEHEQRPKTDTIGIFSCETMPAKSAFLAAFSG